MIFVNSMSDLFHESVSFEFIYEVITAIEFSPQHIFQILTKRPVTAMLFARWYKNKRKGWPLPRNIWLGVSVEDQKTADERIPTLLQVPAAVKWLSVEPMLGKINIRKYLQYDCDCGICNFCNGGKAPNMIDWVVVGGESGPNARPMHPDWARFIRDQCKAAGIPFFFKQWGEWFPTAYIKKYPSDKNDEFYVAKLWYADGYPAMAKVGKKKAGNLLDGIRYEEYPKAIKK